MKNEFAGPLFPVITLNLSNLSFILENWSLIYSSNKFDSFNVIGLNLQPNHLNFR